MSESRRTVPYDRHVALGAKMVEFAGWRMPLHYAGGILQEHLATRRRAGLFDVSHMGRFAIGGRGALPFLQHALTNNAAALGVGQAQYTMIPTPDGAAVDDAYLCRFVEEQYLLVVNAANRDKDWEHLQSILARFPDAEISDVSEATAMLSLQGPQSQEILQEALGSLALPATRRNALSVGATGATAVQISRTGYTGEPVCFELFMASRDAVSVWDMLAERGAVPVGLGARDTLRLEAGLPLYGHELGADPKGQPIPILAAPHAGLAVSLSSQKGDYVGCEALEMQHECLRRITSGDNSDRAALPRIVLPVAILGKAVARPGAKVFAAGDHHAGWVTSGTMVPYWKSDAEGRPSDAKAMRPICLALLDSDLREGDCVQVDVRGRRADARVVAGHLRSQATYAQPVVCE